MTKLEQYPWSGIPREIQLRIFIPFFTTKEDGSGVGLSLSRQIMRMHGGTITCRSSEGKGTTFALRF
jgi:signal transduction histidine kinase